MEAGPEKLCKGCGLTLPVENFTSCRRSPDGIDWRCRPCKKLSGDKYRLSDHGRVKRRALEQSQRGPTSAHKLQRRRDYAEQHPEKVRARWLVGNAVRRGYMPKPDSTNTWKNRWEFHHPDHSRPYFGVWLRTPEHRLVDLGNTPCPECTDYTEVVRLKLMEDWGLYA